MHCIAFPFDQKCHTVGFRAPSLGTNGIDSVARLGAFFVTVGHTVEIVGECGSRSLALIG